MRPQLLLAGAVAALMASSAEARVNATGAVEVFLVSECAKCTTDKNSIFCSEAKGGDSDNWVFNGTLRVTIGMKKTQAIWNQNGNEALGPADGAKYCWSGTFGKLTNNNGNFSDHLGSASVLVKLDCDQTNLFYRQCVLPAQMSIILMSIAAIVFVVSATMLCFCCGCCKCCNEKGDESRWGMCNRFCPWCTICADKHLRPKEAAAIVEEERSLTGKSAKLNTAYGKSKEDAAKDKEKDVELGSGAFSSSNPLSGKK